MEFPASMNDLLEAVDGLPHHERIAHAAAIGKAFRGDERLVALIEQLLAHEAPDLPDYEADDGIRALFQDQATNVASNHLRDQLAMFMAVAAQEQAVLKRVHGTNSKWFKKLTAREMVRYTTDDGVLSELISAATPFVRKPLLQHAARAGRFDAIEGAWDALYHHGGVDVVCKTLHRCSPDFVRARLPEFLENRNLNWKELAFHHGPIVVETMEAEFSDTTVETDWRRIWDAWLARLTPKPRVPKPVPGKRFRVRPAKVGPEHKGAIRNLYFKAKQTAAIWALFERFSYNYQYYTLPPFISNFVVHFARVLPDKLTDYFYDSIRIDTWNNVIHTVDFRIFTAKRSLSFDRQLRLVRRVMELATPKRFYDKGAAYLIQSFCGQWTSIVANNSPCNQRRWFRTFADYYANLSSNSESYSGWFGGLQSRRQDVHTNWRSHVWNWFQYTFNALVQQTESVRRQDSVTHGSQYLEMADFCLGVFEEVFFPDFVLPQSKVSIPEHQQRLSILQNGHYVWSYWTHLPSLLSYWNNVLVGCLEGNKMGDTNFTLYWFRTSTAIIQAIGLIKKRTMPEWTEDDVAANVAACNDALDVVIGPVADSIEHHVNSHANHALVLLEHARPAMTLRIFRFWTKEELTALGRHNTHVLQQALRFALEALNGPGLAPEERDAFSAHLGEMLGKVLDPETSGLSETVIDLLLRYQDVADHGVRKVLTKACDKNSESERRANLNTLICATAYSRDGTQFRRTLSYLAGKIRNDKASMRAHVLSCITEASPEVADKALWFGDTEAVIEVWLGILTDALESQDMDDPEEEIDPTTGLPMPVLSRAKTVVPPTRNHPILKHLLMVSQAALLYGAANADAPVFDLGVEIQWRIIRFRLGERDGSKQFRIRFGPNLMARGQAIAATYIKKTGLTKAAYDTLLLFPQGSEPQFVDGVLNAYNERVTDWVKDVDNSPDYLCDLIAIVGTCYTEIPRLANCITKIQTDLDDPEVTEKDDDGVYIIDWDHPLIVTFNALCNFYGEKNWEDDETIVALLDRIMHSRQANDYLFSHWLLRYNRMGTKTGTRPGAKQVRDQAVQELLAISPSAIHIRFVWRHLVRWRQDLLDPYIDSENRSAFFGVFYKKPADRGSLQVKADPVVGTLSIPSAAGRAALGLGAVTTVLVVSEKPRVDEVMRTEAKAKEELQEELDDGSIESKVWFMLEACYGLDRLLPRQCAELAKARLATSQNRNRGVPDRVAATIRWTLLPTVWFGDVIRYVEANEHPEDPKVEPLSVNLLEALIKGVMCNDEPLAPLLYLLTPRFLSSDRARIAVYAIGQVLRHMGPGGLTKTLRLLLTGQRRTALKITAYKEVIRLLVAKPSEEHMNIIAHEWDRNEVHRDVRIAIIKGALTFLRGGQGHDLAWRILTEAVDKYTDQTEMLAALIGAQPETPIVRPPLDGITSAPRLTDMFEEMAKLRIPPAHCDRFARDIILRLADGRFGGLSNLDPDIEFLAIALLMQWRTFGEIREPAAVILARVLSDTAMDKISSSVPDKAAMYGTRWNRAASDLYTISGMVSTSEGSDAMRDNVVVVVTNLVNRIEEMSAQVEVKRAIAATAVGAWGVHSADANNRLVTISGFPQLTVPEEAAEFLAAAGHCDVKTIEQTGGGTFVAEIFTESRVMTTALTKGELKEKFVVVEGEDEATILIENTDYYVFLGQLRACRHALMRNVASLVALLPPMPLQYRYYSIEFEDRLLEPLQESGLFWATCLTREADRLYYHMSNIGELSWSILHRAVLHADERPTFEAVVMKVFNTLKSKQGYSHQHLTLMNQMYQFSGTPAQEVIMGRMLLKYMAQYGVFAVAHADHAIEVMDRHLTLCAMGRVEDKQAVVAEICSAIGTACATDVTYGQSVNTQGAIIMARFCRVFNGDGEIETEGNDVVVDGPLCELVLGFLVSQASYLGRALAKRGEQALLDEVIRRVISYVANSPLTFINAKLTAVANGVANVMQSLQSYHYENLRQIGERVLDAIEGLIDFATDPANANAATRDLATEVCIAIIIRLPSFTKQRMPVFFAFVKTVAERAARYATPRNLNRLFEVAKGTFVVSGSEDIEGGDVAFFCSGLVALGQSIDSAEDGVNVSAVSSLIYHLALKCIGFYAEKVPEPLPAGSRATLRRWLPAMEDLLQTLCTVDDESVRSNAYRYISTFEIVEKAGTHGDTVNLEGSAVANFDLFGY